LQCQIGAKCESVRRETWPVACLLADAAKNTDWHGSWIVNAMTLIATFSDRLPVRASTKTLLRGIVAFASAEFAVRLVRLLAVIVMAQRLSPEILGAAALALTIFELMRVLANIGVGQQIIAASDALLEATCNTAHKIFWCWCVCLTTAQLMVAACIAIGWGDRATGGMLAILSLVYLIMPGGLVQCYLLMRGGRAPTTARIGASQTISDHILTACLLLAWASPWSIVLPKLLTAPIWLLSMRRALPWHPTQCTSVIPARALLGQAFAILASEVMVALRTQADKLIVAAILGVQTLGVYFFAFNAGIGLLTSIITAFGTLSFPMLCAATDPADRTRLVRTLLLAATTVVVPLVVLQVVLAPVYVPLVFGARWADAISLVATLCLAGIPMTLNMLASNYLRSQGAAHIDAVATFLASALALVGLTIGAKFGGLQLAASLWVGGLCAVAIPYAFYAFNDNRIRSLPALNKELPQ
jgi:lipopolysaccharide exporter